MKLHSILVTDCLITFRVHIKTVQEFPDPSTYWWCTTSSAAEMGGSGDETRPWSDVKRKKRILGYKFSLSKVCANDCHWNSTVYSNLSDGHFGIKLGELSWDFYCNWLITGSWSTRRPLNKVDMTIRQGFHVLATWPIHVSYQWYTCTSTVLLHIKYIDYDTLKRDSTHTYTCKCT